MKRLVRKLDKRRAFTIVELLTIMSIIILLISLLVPSLNRVRRYALYVKQRNHFKSIGTALTLFNAEWEDYPDSARFDNSGPPYCGAMKLCEAMVGQDLLGFHPQSRFYQVGTTNASAPSPLPLSVGGNDLYPARRSPPPAQNVIEASERERKELYLTRENANAYRMGDLYDPDSVNSKFNYNEAAYLPVLCDVYGTAMHKQTGKTVGSPILYYKADTTRQGHTFGTPNNIYDHTDNIDLIDLGVLLQPTFSHPMGSSGTAPFGDPPVLADPSIFYEITLNEKISVPKPYNDDSFILISAGFDGLYGTPDDVFNFDK